MNREQFEEHFRFDTTYPITAEGIHELWENLRHLTAEERTWAREHVPPGVYACPEDAIRAVRWGKPNHLQVGSQERLVSGGPADRRN
jgi:hypothetical protein